VDDSLFLERDFLKKIGVFFSWQREYTLRLSAFRLLVSQLFIFIIFGGA
jgi:hypothetical protein